MAKHKFDGEWNYFEIVEFGDPTDDGKMLLKIPDAGSGDLAPGSKHNGDLTGKAKTDSIEMLEKTRGHETKYKGELLLEDGDNMVIVGTFKGKNVPIGP